jgi:(S)-mandelate dehydrogenase
MHGMTPKGAKRPAKKSAKATVEPLNVYTQHPDYKTRHSRFPSSAFLRRGAPKKVPLFAYEYGDTGAGADVGIAHNWSAFDNIKIVPRYGSIATPPPVDVTLFGKQYSAPIGIAPMGGPSLVWPAADLAMAKAAQAARVPYTLGVAGGATIEQVAEVAGDVFWLQLYRFWKNEHEIGFDLIRRATAAGVNVLALTVDVPARTTRTRESYAGLGGEFKPTPRMIYEMLKRPNWLMALVTKGYPRFATISQYAAKNLGKTNPTSNETIRFARTQMGGIFTWDEIARYRDKWKGPMALKGVLHPEDAEKAVSLGIEGIWVSNHGGRQIEALAPSIDCLPAIVSAVGKKATIVLDSGVRSGQDVMRALALGAQAAFAGKAFLWSVAAMGDDGPVHLIDLMIEELRSSLGQIGAASPAAAREATISHPGAWNFERRKK